MNRVKAKACWSYCLLASWPAGSPARSVQRRGLGLIGDLVVRMVEIYRKLVAAPTRDPYIKD